MDRLLRRRLDVLILLCSALLGVVLTFLFFSERAGLSFLFYALIPTGLITVLAYAFVVSPGTSGGDEDAHP